MQTDNKKPGKLLAVVNIITILAVLLGGAAYLLFLPHETVAEDENRRLASFPEFSPKSYIDGSFTGGIADYFDDTVHGRDRIKKFIAADITPLKGRKYGGDEDGAELYGIAFEHSEETPAVTTAAATTAAVTHTTVSSPAVQTTAVTTAPIPAEEPAAEGGEINSNILVVNKRGLPLYPGGDVQGYADTINEYKKKLGDVNVWSMVVPTAGGLYIPSNYKSLAVDEKKDIDAIAAALEGAVPVDAYTSLAAHKSEDIYARTDHHWMALGAFYAAKAFTEAAGLPFKELSEYEELHLHDYLGTFYGYTQSPTLLNNPEEFVYYRPKNEVTVDQYDTSFRDPLDVALLVPSDNMTPSGYYYVFGMDNRIAHVHTKTGNGRKLVIFKDSYGNALLPFLTYSFEDIYLCDMRYFDLNAVSFIKQVKATDVLFSMCTFSATGPNLSCLKADMYK